MRSAIFGGTFDPVHEAHLAVAREALEKFTLDRVIFIPAANPPHKTGSSAPFEDRYRMVELACADNERLEPSRIEAGPDRSFSVVTIEKLKAAHPTDEWFFLIGADAFSEIQTWFRWQDALRLVDFIVVSRPGHRYAVPAGARVHRLETLALDVSSSVIREKLAAGRRPANLPPKVLEYILEKGLYRAPSVIQ